MGVRRLETRQADAEVRTRGRGDESLLYVANLRRQRGDTCEAHVNLEGATDREFKKGTSTESSHASRENQAMKAKGQLAVPKSAAHQRPPRLSNFPERNDSSRRERKHSDACGGVHFDPCIYGAWSRMRTMHMGDEEIADMGGGGAGRYDINACCQTTLRLHPLATDTAQVLAGLALKGNAGTAGDGVGAGRQIAYQRDVNQSKETSRRWRRRGTK
ncbi:hypothetical protein C8R45DRAFT_944358 [Mycena sanguinolenta]|nr:hypothetical protein C8R45DRAFT_944358 [Mycena sanguinolenta]